MGWEAVWINLHSAAQLTNREIPCLHCTKRDVFGISRTGDYKRADCAEFADAGRFEVGKVRENGFRDKSSSYFLRWS